jgi:cell division protein FtsB
LPAAVLSLRLALGERVRGLLLIPALVAAVLVYAALDTDSGIRPWLHMRADVASSSARRAEIRREIRRLEGEAAALESDPFAIESAIRADLKLARRGEQVVRFSTEKETNPRFP